MWRFDEVFQMLRPGRCVSFNRLKLAAERWRVQYLMEDGIKRAPRGNDVGYQYGTKSSLVIPKIKVYIWTSNQYEHIYDFVKMLEHLENLY